MADTPSEADRREVIALITSAFEVVDREDGVTLHEANVIDDYGTIEERLAGRQLDLDRHWREVPDKDIEEDFFLLSFLDPKGFRYYLPAYMIWSLKNLESASGSPSPDATIFALTNWYDERYSLFTQEQCRAVYCFLKHLARYGRGYVKKAQQALDRYWVQFA